MLLSIITPTYNREDYIDRLYSSLKKQICFDFEWIVVDDGSSDNTEERYKEILKSDIPFRISYKRINNSGKHKAINSILDDLKGDLSLILDSDDWLPEYAVDKIKSDWEEYRTYDIAGLVYKRDIVNRENVHFPRKIAIEYMDNYITNSEYPNDVCEVVRTDLLKINHFPEIENEKFCDESVVWHAIGLQKKYVYIDDFIYCCEYLPEGLSNNAKKIRISSPRGQMIKCRVYFGERISRKLKMKYTMIFIIYAFFAGLRLRDIAREFKNEKWKILMIPCGHFLYKLWKVKYE